MQLSNLISAECFVSWNTADASHHHWQYFPKLDLGRDRMPAGLSDGMQEQEGDLFAIDVSAGDGAPATGPEERRKLHRPHVEDAYRRRHVQGPFAGRFYPRGLLAEVSGAGTTHAQDTRPFRVLEIGENQVSVDLGHPLSGYPLKVGGRITERPSNEEQRGGGRNDLLAVLTASGPGMQCPPPGTHVEFHAPGAFERDDPSDDAHFYAQPRMVHHIDSRARAFVNELYRRLIHPEDRVLDLMSSWVSHLQGAAAPERVTGLGMNPDELSANRELNDFVVQDLNREPRLPWDNECFDAAVCTVSVEYLVDPYRVFAEVARVLRPGGRFIVAFADRWFPPKAIRLWTRLHPFERMGLVSEYFRRDGLFNQLETESRVGWPRPEDDKYYGELPNADPVFAVWARRV